ncbi:MAG: cell wall hydrolase [Xanthobacteraceae bacterium]
MPNLMPGGLGLSDAVDGFFQASDAARKRRQEDEAPAALSALLDAAAQRNTASPSPVFAPQAAAQQAAPAGPRAPSFTMPKGTGVTMTNPADDVDTMARTIAAEAGNQGDQGMAAVAHVIANRAKIAGLTPTQVIERPHQFEAYDNGSADRYDPGNPAYDKARQIAQAVLAGQIPDPTNGATHYLNPDLQAQMGRAQPSWAPGNGTRIGAHVFYSLPKDAAALYGKSAPIHAAQGQVASSDVTILPPPSPAMQRAQDEAKAKGVGQTDPDASPSQALMTQAATRGATAQPAPAFTGFAGVNAGGATSMTPQLKAAALAAYRNPNTRPVAASIIGEILKGKQNEYDIKEINGHAVLWNKHTAAMIPLSALDKAPEPFTLGEGQTRFSGSGGVIARGPDKTEKDPEKARVLNDSLANWQRYHLPDPNDPANAKYWQEYSSKLLGGQGGVTVNNQIGKEETEEGKELGKERGKRAGELEAAGANAPNMMAKLELLGLVHAGLSTGMLGPLHANAASLAQSLGVDPAQLGLNPNQAVNAEVAQKLTNELVTGMIGKGGFPANNFSDADRIFLTKIFPSVSNRPEANSIAVSVMKAIEQRKMDVADAWGEYQERLRAENKTPSIANFEREFRQKIKGEQLFKDANAQLRALPTGPAAPPAPAKPAQGQPDRSAVEAEMRRRGLIK